MDISSRFVVVNLKFEFISSKPHGIDCFDRYSEIN